MQLEPPDKRKQNGNILDHPRINIPRFWGIFVIYPTNKTDGGITHQKEGENRPVLCF